jgi:hypothetical protein
MRPSLALRANADRVFTILSRFDVRNPGAPRSSSLRYAAISCGACGCIDGGLALRSWQIHAGGAVVRLCHELQAGFPFHLS